ncbi:MAG: hypothetical protein ABIX01_10830 [Chitinophagaceae bacterium]
MKPHRSFMSGDKLSILLLISVLLVMLLLTLQLLYTAGQFIHSSLLLISTVAYHHPMSLISGH